MIIEYMLIREMDRKRAPSWVEDGGYFMDPDDKTMIGWSPSRASRPLGRLVPPLLSRTRMSH